MYDQLVTCFLLESVLCTLVPVWFVDEKDLAWQDQVQLAKFYWYAGTIKSSLCVGFKTRN